MKAPTFFLLLALAAAGYAAPKHPNWKGKYWETEPVAFSKVRSEPHTSFYALAQELTRILSVLPRTSDGYTVEWIPMDTAEGGRLKVTAWDDSAKQEKLLEL